MNHTTIDRTRSGLALKAYVDLGKSADGLRALAALLECYGDHGASGDGYTPPANLAMGLSSLLDMAATSISQQSETVGELETTLLELERQLNAATAGDLSAHREPGQGVRHA